MICNICKIKEATVFFTQIVEGKMKKKAFCEECSKSKEVNETSLFGFPELLLEFSKMQDHPFAEEKITRICKQCGFSQEKFKKTGRLGCGNCYSTFKDDLTIILHKMHEGLLHKGKVPLKIASVFLKQKKIKQLEAELDKVISAEKYEEAALLRDEIHQLKNKRSRVQPSCSKDQKIFSFDDHKESDQEVLAPEVKVKK